MHTQQWQKKKERKKKHTHDSRGRGKRKKKTRIPRSSALAVTNKNEVLSKRKATFIRRGNPLPAIKVFFPNRRKRIVKIRHSSTTTTTTEHVRTSWWVTVKWSDGKWGARKRENIHKAAILRAGLKLKWRKLLNKKLESHYRLHRRRNCGHCVDNWPFTHRCRQRWNPLGMINEGKTPRPWNFSVFKAIGILGLSKKKTGSHRVLRRNSKSGAHRTYNRNKRP